LGGVTPIGPFLPRILALMVNVPVGVRRMITPRTGPLSPRLSLYLKPKTPSDPQNGCPELSSPWGSGKSCMLGLLPLAMTVRSAPPALPSAVGSPTMVLALPLSRALPVILRRAGSPGFGSLTTRDLPRIAWSAAGALR
jgi:hypothetical protein